MKHRMYEEMKDSGVAWLGNIPAHWETLSLKRVLSSVEYGISAPLMPSGEVAVLRMSNIQGGKVTLADVSYVDDVEPNLLLKENDLLFNRTNSLDLVGKVGIFRDSNLDKVSFASYLVRFRTKDGVDPQYLCYVLNIREILERARTMALPSISQANLNPNRYGYIRICLPPIKEQRAIVAFLDKKTSEIDAFIQLKETQIETLSMKRQTLINQAMRRGLDPNVSLRTSGNTWLCDIPEHWEIVQLRRCISKFVDYRGKTPRKTDNGIPLITAGAIRDGIIQHERVPDYIAPEDYEEWMSRGFPKRGDVLLTTEAPLGETAQIQDENIALAQRVILFKVNPKKITNDYLKYHWLSPFGQGELWRNATGSTALGIKADRLYATKVLLPPITEQQHITSYLDRETEHLGIVSQTIQDQIVKLRNFKDALISKAITGKIDLREGQQ